MDNNNQPIKKNVNLLPDDLRKREDREIAKAGQKRVVEIEMTDPKQGFTFNKDKPAQKGPGFWRSLIKTKPQEEVEFKEARKEFSEEEQASIKEEREEKIETGRIKKKSWLDRLFGTSEERERKRTEKLALARAREESMRRKREAIKRIKLEKKLQHQQKDKTVFEGTVNSRQAEKEQRKRMRQLMRQSRQEEKERRRQEKQKMKLVVPAESPAVSGPNIAQPASAVMPPPLPNKPKFEPDKGIKWFDKKKKEIDQGTSAPKRQASTMDVNLIPEELLKRKELKLSRQILNLIFLAVVCLLIIGSVYFGLVWYQGQITLQIKMVDNKIDKIKTEIAAYDQLKDRAVVLQKKLKAVEGLFGRHLYWTEFFKQLENYTIPSVYYTNFLADAGNGTVVMSAVADSYQSLAQQLVSFQQADDFIDEVIINSASAQLNNEEKSIEGVLFNVNLKLKPKVFLKEGQ